jgi:GWxTD domain-containing protein
VRRKPFLHAVVARAVVILLFATGSAGTAKEELAPQYRRWLDWEVEVIMTPAERDVFSSLPSDRARDRFIEDFWRARDPTAGTDRNEYREEHARRLEAAQKLFGSRTRPAGRSDRGRTYILLGAPEQVDRLADSRNFYPLEIWSYTRAPSVGLFHPLTLLFYKQHGFGDYKLYSPSLDGVNALLTPTQSHRFLMQPNDVATRQALIDGLTLSASELPVVDAAIYVAPQVTGAAAEAVLARVQSPPAVNAVYLDRYRNGLVETNVSFRTFPLLGSVDVFPDANGGGFAELALELPSDSLAFIHEGDQYHLQLEVDGRLETRGATSIAGDGDAFEGRVDVRLEPSEMEACRSLPLLYQQRIFVVPGDYTLHLTAREPLTSAFGQTSLFLHVPRPTEELVLSSLLLTAGGEWLPSPESGGERPFLRRGRLVLPRVSGRFAAGSDLHVYYEITLPPGGASTGLRASYFVMKDDTVVRRTEAALPGESDGVRTVEGTISLEGLSPSPYTLVAQVQDEGGRRNTVAEESFEVVSDAIPPGRIDAIAREGPSPVEVATRLGEYWLSLGDVTRARPLLERAYRAEPGSNRTRVPFGRVLALAGELTLARDLLAAALGEDPHDADAHLAMAYVQFQMGEPERAVETYRRLLAFAPSARAWNGLAEVLLKGGRRPEARVCLERSLEIDPSQPDVAKTLEALKSEPSSEPR